MKRFEQKLRSSHEYATQPAVVFCAPFAGLSGFPSQINQDTWESKVVTNIHKHSEPWYNRHDMKKMTKLELQFFNQPRGGRSFATDRMKSKLGQILWHWISQAISQEPSDGVYLLYAEDTFYCKGLSLLSLLASKLSIHGSQFEQTTIAYNCNISKRDHVDSLNS